jgi:hypothetical protein
MIPLTPQIITAPTDLTAAFAEPPLTGWVWKYALDLGSSNFSSDMSGNVRVTIASDLTFLAEVIPGDFVFIPILGNRPNRVLSKNSTSFLVEFDATQYTPGSTEVRLMKAEFVELEVDSMITSIKIQGHPDGIRRLNPYAIIRRAFNYAPPSSSATHWFSYKLEISGTSYTALRSAGGSISLIWGVWPYVAYFQNPLNILQSPQKFPVQFEPGTPTAINPQTFILTPNATQRVFLLQPGTVIFWKIENETFTTEPTAQPPWLEIEQSGNDIHLFGTVPMTGNSWNLEYTEGANDYNVNFTVPAGIYSEPYCADRIGFVWLGSNGQWKTYYFAEDYAEDFAEVNGDTVRTEGVQRYVGLDEFREGVTVAERYLDNTTKDWLKDLETSPAIYRLPNLERYYIEPSTREWQKRPKKAENNSIRLSLVSSKKTPTIYEG